MLFIPYAFSSCNYFFLYTFPCPFRIYFFIAVPSVLLSVCSSSYHAFFLYICPVQFISYSHCSSFCPSSLMYGSSHSLFLYTFLFPYLIYHSILPYVIFSLCICSSHFVLSMQNPHSHSLLVYLLCSLFLSSYIYRVFSQILF